MYICESNKTCHQWKQTDSQECVQRYQLEMDKKYYNVWKEGMLYYLCLLKM